MASNGLYARRPPFTTIGMSCFDTFASTSSPLINLRTIVHHGLSSGLRYISAGQYSEVRDSAR